MDLWIGIIIASALVYSWKLLGFLVPNSVLNNPVVSRVAGLLTVALLAALLGVQGLTGSGQIELDARIPAIGVAAVLLYFKAPFIVMVAAAALVAALLRLLFGF
jgi:branched-subunit amino acid transport protein